MGILEFIGELCTIDSWYFKRWRFLFSFVNHRQANLESQHLGPVKALLVVLWALSHIAVELALLGLLGFVILGRR
jgi:hypothetical protein